MSKDTYTQLIQDILDAEANKKTFNESRLELAWRVGYLTGILDNLAHDDSSIANLLERRLEKLTGHKKKKG